jgi:hypothetical protein
MNLLPVFLLTNATTAQFDRVRMLQCRKCALSTDIILECKNALRPAIIHHGFQVIPQEKSQVRVSNLDTGNT